MELKNIFSLTVVLCYIAGIVGADEYFLDIGDTCSWEDEVYRLKYYNSTKDLQDSDPMKDELFNNFVMDSITNGRKYCKATKQTMCSRTTNRCVCGEYSQLVLAPSADTSNQYIVEYGDNGDRHCSYGKGAACVSEAMNKPFTKGDSTLTVCQKGTGCLSVADKSECSFGTIMRHVAKNPSQDKAGFLEDLYGGKICTCQMQTKRKGTAAEGFQGDRNKRSIGASDEHAKFMDMAISSHNSLLMLMR